jgi:hypothetical protein
MRKRTLITALIMFAAIGTGSAGAFSFGGGFFSGFHLFSHHVAPAHKAKPAKTKLVTAVTPSASCAMYGCATSTTIACDPVVVVVLDVAILPPVCTVKVTDLGDSAPPTGTVTVTASGAPTQTCTLVPGTGATSTCTVSFGTFVPADLLQSPTVSLGLFSQVVATYNGGGGLDPSSGSTTILVSVGVLNL